MMNVDKQSQSKYTSLDNSVHDFAFDTVNTLLENTWQLRNSSDREKFFELVEEARTLSQEANYTIGVAACLILDSVMLSRQHYNGKALAAAQEAKLLIETTKADVWTCRLYLSLSEIYLRLNQINTALDFAKEHLKVAKTLNNHTYIAAATLAMGMVYSNSANHKQAIAYFIDTTTLFEEINDKWGMIASLINLSMEYRKTGDLEKSEPCAQKVMDLARSIDNSRGISIAHTELGNIFLEKKEFTLAKNHFIENIDVASKLNLNDVIVKTNIALAKIPDLKNPNQQQSYIDTALKKATELEDDMLISECYKNIADLAKENQDFKTAFTALEHHMRLEQDLLKEANQDAINSAMVVFETEKAQHEAKMHRLKTIELEDTVKELELLNSKVRELSIRDSLTGLYNRRYLEEQIHKLFEQSIRYDTPLSICLLDIDHFKTINDNFSHQIGDTVLQKFAEILLQGIRSADVVARFGGEEFIILMAEKSLDNAHKLSERLRLSVESYDWSSIAKNLQVSASFGLSSKDLDLDNLDNPNPERLISLADKRLYLAKENGRNRVCSSCTPPST